MPWCTFVSVLESMAPQDVTARVFTQERLAPAYELDPEVILRIGSVKVILPVRRKLKNWLKSAKLRFAGSLSLLDPRIYCRVQFSNWSPLNQYWASFLCFLVGDTGTIPLSQLPVAEWTASWETRDVEGWNSYLICRNFGIIQRFQSR